MPSSRYIKPLAAFSHSSLKGFKFISVFVFCLFFFPEHDIQISRSCSNRLCLNLPREFRYCNGWEFELPSWINKPLFGSKAIVSRYNFVDIWDTKQRVLSLNLISFSWYVFSLLKKTRKLLFRSLSFTGTDFSQFLCSPIKCSSVAVVSLIQ